MPPSWPTSNPSWPKTGGSSTNPLARASNAPAPSSRASASTPGSRPAAAMTGQAGLAPGSKLFAGGVPPDEAEAFLHFAAEVAVTELLQAQFIISGGLVGTGGTVAVTHRLDNL